MRKNLQEIHPFFKENKRFQSKISIGVGLESGKTNLGYEEEFSSPKDHENSEIYSEMNENLSPFLPSQTELDDHHELDDKNSISKFRALKSKIELNKAKNRLDGINFEGLSSTISESVTKSPQSTEKKNKNEKNMKDQWILFKKKFFFSEKIKKYKKKVFFFIIFK